MRSYLYANAAIMALTIMVLFLKVVKSPQFLFQQGDKKGLIQSLFQIATINGVDFKDLDKE